MVVVYFGWLMGRVFWAVLLWNCMRFARKLVQSRSNVVEFLFLSGIKLLVCTREMVLGSSSIVVLGLFINKNMVMHW